MSWIFPQLFPLIISIIILIREPSLHIFECLFSALWSKNLTWKTQLPHRAFWFAFTTPPSLQNSTFVSDVCHILLGKFLPILYTSIPILNLSLNWLVPFARELIEWTASAHVVDQNRVNGTEARPSARQAAGDLEFGELSMSIHRIIQPVFHYNLAPIVREKMPIGYYTLVNMRVWRSPKYPDKLGQPIHCTLVPFTRKTHQANN